MTVHNNDKHMFSQNSDLITLISIGFIPSCLPVSPIDWLATCYDLNLPIRTVTLLER